MLASLRAAAEPTRLRLLALAARGPFCVSEFTAILGQSQPRLSRHLRLLCEAGLLERVREGAHAWFQLPAGAAGELARALLAHLPEEDPILAADRRQVARVLAERARIASESFSRQGADWDEMRALNLPVGAVAETLLASRPQSGLGRLVEIGTGTGSLLALLAPRISEGIGIDASPAMVALARTRLANAGLTHCTVRRADMYRLPIPEASFDLATLQMVLHYAEDPASVLAEAGRVLRPGARLLVVDLAPHGEEKATARLAHRWPGFTDAEMGGWLVAGGLEPALARSVAGPLTVRIWPARRASA
ncbi:MAG TPA: metalloregulator ArsR/SmtB family transcription factor [Acetobacteraceae bacterium]|nr:metalloregulator ArsR/SmtB family transcription factor [Acetobacteraceae bacterium]